MKWHGKIILREFKVHLPYSFGSVAFALIVVTLFTLLAAGDTGLFNAVSDATYHVSHLLHMALSAAATAAMFWGYQRRLGRTMLVGFFGAAVPCSVSDFAIPYFGGRMFGMPMDAHVCIVEHFYLVIPAIFLGMFAGIWVTRLVERSTIFSHSGHVIVSSLASVLYLAGYGGSGWIDFLAPTSGIVFLAVLIPCCFSDIVFPLLFVGGDHVESCLCHHHGPRAPRSEQPEAIRGEGGTGDAK